MRSRPRSSDAGTSSLRSMKPWGTGTASSRTEHGRERARCAHSGARSFPAKPRALDAGGNARSRPRVAVPGARGAAARDVLLLAGAVGKLPRLHRVQLPDAAEVGGTREL